MSVIYSSTCGYAIHAVCRIAELQPEGKGNVGVNEICEGSELSPPFVSKILHGVAKAGLVKSTKGRGGGFRLNRAPEKITLLDIVDVIDGTDTYRRCAVGSFERCNDKQPCPQHDSFKPLRENIIRYLKDTTIADLAEALESKKDSKKVTK
ncbi:MAG: Rrf2 family transcriptional regulator [Planctomycetota bacterium]